MTAGADYKKEQVNAIKLIFEPLVISRLTGLKAEVYGSPLTLKRLKETDKKIE